MILLILPTQLFSKQLLRKELKKNVVSKVIIWEHPQYFSKYKYNKKKLLLHRASMKYYCDYLQKGGKYTVEYLEHGSSVVKIPKSYLVFDPVDKIKLPGAPTYLENPNFLLTKEDYAVYREKSKAFRFHNFFAFGKKVLGKLEKVGSTDKDNRKRMPKNVEIPKVPTNKNDAKWIKEAGDYVDRCFPKNYGNVDDFMYPVTHTTAKKWLKAFIQDRFGNFGNYQDFIRKDDGFLFHSFLSSSLNIGLLTVGEVVAAIFKAKVAINNLEGFYRQLFWREYQRYLHLFQGRWTKLLWEQEAVVKGLV
jgi:deoxyribodipyrimidine photolyase-related protein